MAGYRTLHRESLQPVRWSTTAGMTLWSGPIPVVVKVIYPYFTPRRKPSRFLVASSVDEYSICETDRNYVAPEENSLFLNGEPLSDC